MGGRKHPYLDSHNFPHKFCDSSLLPNSKPQTLSAQIKEMYAILLIWLLRGQNLQNENVMKEGDGG